jgi:hypothetical protein
VSTGVSPVLVPAAVATAILPGPCGAGASLTNGTNYTTTWTPYNCLTSPWNVRVSSNPRIASYSAAQIALQFSRGNTQPVRSQEAGRYDYGHPVYYAAASDPVVNLRCLSYCNRTDNGGIPATFRIPARARPAQGGDAHMAVVQPDGTEIDLWATATPSTNWTAGATVTAIAAANCGNYVTGSGFTAAGPAATAGGACLGAGSLRANELLSGSINHALFLITQCANGWQYPAFANATTDRCTGGSGPPLGGRLWYDVPTETTNANPNLKPWEKAILNALHDYGGYLQDDIGGADHVSGIAFLAESGQAAMSFGLPDPFAALFSQGWLSIPINGAFSLRYIGADPWRPAGVDFAGHFHWLDACSAQATC